MKKCKRSVTIFLVVILLAIFNSGCSTITSFFKKDAAKEEVKEKSTNGRMADLNKAERDKISKVIVDFYTKLYQDPVESYKSTANIPEKVKGIIAERTVNEGSNNPELGIHLPRYVELNGMTSVGYELLKNGSLGSIVPSYIGKNSDSYLYYVKVHLKAKCLPDVEFNKSYTQNAVTKVYEKNANAIISDQLYDYTRIIAKYDVEVIKDGVAYKILRAKEASTRPGFQSRLMILNNDFMQRLPFINTDKGLDNNYINKDDIQVYEKEKAVIQAFFDNMKVLDNERMNLLSTKWKTGVNEFTEFTTKVLKMNVDKNSKEIMEITTDYQNKFSFDSYPLKSNMRKIVSIGNYNVNPHPAYTQKQKRYIVSFEAKVEKTTGIIGQQARYKYDYLVTLSSANDTLKVNGVYLSNYTYLNLVSDKADDKTSDKSTK